MKACREWSKLARGFPEATMEVARHLEACAKCAAAWRELSRAVEAIRCAPERPMSVREFTAHRDAIVQRAELASMAAQEPKRSWGWTVGLATACAIAVVFLAIIFRNEPGDLPSRQHATVAVHAMPSMEATDSAASEIEPPEQIEERTVTKPEPPSRTTRPAALAQRRSRQHGSSKPNPPGPVVSVEPSSIEPTAFHSYRVAWEDMRAREFSRAASRFEEVVAMGDPALVEDSLYWMGVACARARQPGRAQRGLERFLDLFPDSPHASRAQVMLGWLLVETGETARAKETFALAAASSDREVRLSAAKGLFVVGDLLALNTPR